MVQFDEKNVDWVDVDGTGPPPKERKPAPQAIRIAAFVGIVAIGVALIVVFVLSILPNRQQNQQQVEDMNAEIRAAIAACREEQDPDRCLEGLAAQLAQQNGNGDFCTMVETDDPDNCYFMAAFGAKDRSMCAEIQDEALLMECQDALYPDVEFFEDCSGYHSSQRQSNCEAAWIRDQWRDGDCSSPHVDDALCDQSDLLQAAIAAQDPDLCEEISDSSTYGACQELVGYGDRDFDGLSALEEATHGTDDRNPDTDGDGFDDKTEIDNGFDPLS